MVQFAEVNKLQLEIDNPPAGMKDWLHDLAAVLCPIILINQSGMRLCLDGKAYDSLILGSDAYDSFRELQNLHTVSLYCEFEGSASDLKTLLARLDQSETTVMAMLMSITAQGAELLAFGDARVVSTPAVITEHDLILRDTVWQTNEQLVTEFLLPIKKVASVLGCRPKKVSEILALRYAEILPALIDERLLKFVQSAGQLVLLHSEVMGSMVKLVFDNHRWEQLDYKSLSFNRKTYQEICSIIDNIGGYVKIQNQAGDSKLCFYAVDKMFLLKLDFSIYDVAMEIVCFE